MNFYATPKHHGLEKPKGQKKNQIPKRNEGKSFNAKHSTDNNKIL